MLQVQIEGKQTPMLVDTGATYTCVRPKYATHLPLSDKLIETVGFSGIKQLFPVTAPVKITTNEAEIKIPILVSNETPVNLLGRDVLCKFKKKIKIWCSHLGVYIGRDGLNYQMMLRNQAEKAKVYWLVDISTPITQVLKKWRKYIQAQIPKASKSIFDYHCTVFYDKTKSEKFEGEWAPVTLLAILISEVHNVDQCARGEVLKKIKQQGYWSPYMQAMVDKVLNQCEVCAQNNVRKTITTPVGHIPVPEGPFKHLVIDYVDMIKPVHGKRYVSGH